MPIGPLPKPENLKAKAGDNHGSLIVSWNVIPGAYLYEVEYMESPVTATSVRMHVSCSKHSVTIDNLTPGKMYSIFVAGAGSDPRRVWSDELTSYIM
nr:fibronectin type III domain-containing protein [Microbacter margulisiae]